MDLKKNQEIRIIRGDAFSVNFANYHQNEEFERFRQSLRERKFTIGESSVSYRVSNHWGQKNLLPDGCNSEQGEWKKFTFVELVWLKIILHLREFGFSLEKIASVKKDVMKWNNNKNCYGLLEYYIAQSRVSTDDPYIIVWADGKADIASVNELEISKMFFSDEDRLLIPLKPILSAMGMSTYKSELKTPLSKNESELIDEINIGENKEVKVRVQKGKISEIETSRTYPDTTTLKDIEKTLEKEGAFAEINIKVTGGKKRSVEVIKRKKIGHQS